jgi:DNA-binding NarL/FixJ family response regulator
MRQAKNFAATSRIAVVEDDPGLRNHFIEIISDAVDLDVAGVASTLTSARGLFKLRPDLFLVDIGLPDGSGLDLVPEIKRETGAKILIVTSFGDRGTVVKAIRAGADGYLVKDSTPSALVEGMKVTLAGGSPISASAAVFLLERLRDDDAQEHRPEIDASNTLTPREIELLNLFARGLTYKEAAATLGVSPLSIGNYVKSIYSKLAVHSRSEAVYEALKTGQLEI